MIGYALSSAVPEVVITAEIASALLQNLRRFEQWWKDRSQAAWNNLVNVSLVWSAETGVIPSDPELAVVQVVASLPDAPQDVAYHTTDSAGRPMCLISWAAVQAEGGTVSGPNGLVAAISHEILESRADPLCILSVPLPGANTTGDLSTPLEVCDWVQGSDYEEPGSPGIFVANAVGPRFFMQGATGLLDIRSDVTTGAVTSAFQETPGGYHEVITGSGVVSQVFGDLVPAATRARIQRTGTRGGQRAAQARPR